MADCMDISMDQLTFDIQSIYLSFEERRWINKQRCIHKLDESVQSLGDLHKTIHDSHHFFALPTTLLSLDLIPKPTLSGQTLMYYPSALNGIVGTRINNFRLHHQQVFQLTFNDLSKYTNYRLLIILLEGMIFASSQTVHEYCESMVHEMRKCLTSFESFIRTRTSKIQNVISILALSSLPSYECVFSTLNTNIGIVFQMLPKFRYYRNHITPCNSILVVDNYANYTISPEELRYVEYMINMKTKRHQDSLLQQTVNVQSNSTFSFGMQLTGGSNNTYAFPRVPDIYHSLPIDYPYDEKIVYDQNYPTFWKGTKHIDENNTALFESVALELNTPEYTFVQRLFNKTVSESLMKIVAIERIQNSHLWEKFRSHRLYMRRKNGNDNVNEQWLFHGTNSDNHHQIISHGFNRSYCRDTVLYGRGVYFARYASYSCKYSDRRDLSFLFLCRVLVGRHTVGSNNVHIPPSINLPNGQKVQTDSTTDQQDLYTIVCTFHDDQNYPEYIITYSDQTNRP